MRLKLKEILKKHNKWLMSLGIRFNKKGKVINNFKGYPFPDLTTRNSIPTSDRICGVALKRDYATKVPAGKTISVAYNKGPYMLVDKKDFKTMGRKI